MPDIIHSLKSDARFVLQTQPFWYFIKQLSSEDKWNISFYIPKLPENANDWLLYQLPYLLSLGEPCLLFKKRLYNDENYYRAYLYSILVRFCNIEHEVEFYHGSRHYDNGESVTISFSEKYEYINWEIESNFDNLAVEVSQKERLINEISLLTCYAISLFY